jgi:hypothetical protein
MKETGLMFKAPLVRAILSGQKTQTRRIAKDVRHPDLGNWYAPGALVLEGEPQHVIHRACPWGQPGDRIYVRETFGYGGDAYTPDIYFRADQPEAPIQGCWHPAIHMRKADARIWLDVTGVRVERLQDITEADADAEGCERLDAERYERDWTLCPKCGGTRLHDALGSGGGVIHDVDCLECDTYVKRFRHLWESTGGDWSANPWVWVIDFKRITHGAL